MERRVSRTTVFALFALSVTLIVSGCAMPRPLAAPASAPFNGGTLSPAIQVPELALRRADGRAFSTAETRGRISLFFFGYTNCPDVCPLTLFHVAQIRKELGRQAANVDAYFVTVDPARDTPARMAEYSAKFDPAIVPLTGTDEELAQVRDAFGIVAEKREAPTGAAGYFMDHTAAIFLVDRDSAIKLIYPYGMEDAMIVADLQRLIAR
ncbi:MAG: SCO family protein [Chloroflexi bacterium]|nr:SCO family protein [Chloroflexota bacterium]